MSLIIKTGILILNILYSFIKLFPQKKKITIISRQSNEPSLDITMLADKINELHHDHEVVILCRTLDGGITKKAGYLLHMISQMYHMSTSEAVILDSYCIAASILRHKNTLLIIQMWHSIGTMKKFGYSILDKEEGSSSKIAKLMKMHSNYDYIFSAGDGYKEHLAQGFNYPADKIITMPLPRVELLKNREYGNLKRGEIFNTYPALDGKINLLYVPTFRKTDDEAFIASLEELCKAVDYDKYNLIVKPHPLTNMSGFKPCSAITDKEFSSFDMLFACDIVISDYSCIMYEAAVLNKPIYLYTYDYDEYMRTRDIFMNYLDEVPGPVCHTAAQLISSINSSAYDFEKLRSFLNKYVYMGSLHETEDMVNFIFEHRKTASTGR